MKDKNYGGSFTGTCFLRAVGTGKFAAECDEMSGNLHTCFPTKIRGSPQQMCLGLYSDCDNLDEFCNCSRVCRPSRPWVEHVESAPDYLKEYYEIVGESRPLSAFFPKHADFFSNHETKQSSKFQSDPSTNCFTINDVWNINCWLSTVHFLLSYFIFVSHFTQVL